MALSIEPYSGDKPNKTQPAMRPWPSLADRAFCLRNTSRRGESIFFYDCLPPAGGVSVPLMLLIHGLGDEADSWRHLIPLLGQSCRVLALDLPGFGRSQARGKVSLKRHAAAVLSLLEKLAPAGPVYLAGNSMGAIVAEAAALRKPDLVRGLVLIGGSIPGGPPNPGLLPLVKMLFSRKWYRAYRNAPEDAWASLHPYYADLDSMPAEDREFLKERVMARVHSPAQEKAFFASQRDIVRAYIFDALYFARKIRHYPGKILMIWGENDRIIPLSSANTFKALRSDIEIKVIPGAGHLPKQEKPEECARLMLEFASFKLSSS